MYEELVAKIEAERAMPERRLKNPAPRDYFKIRFSDDRIAGLKNTLAQKFGEQYGWKIAGHTFGLETLSRGGVHSPSDLGSTPMPFVDHPYLYRNGRRAAAMAVHVYAQPDFKGRFKAWAESQKLTMWLPDYPSWHNVKATTLIVYLGPVGLADLQRLAVDISL